MAPRFVISEDDGSTEGRGKTLRAEWSFTTINSDDAFSGRDTHYGIPGGCEPLASEKIDWTRLC